MLDRMKAWVYKDSPDRCNTCGKKLTDQEKEYYVTTCETCEKKWIDAANKERRRRF